MATKIIPVGFSQAAIQLRHDAYIRPAVCVFGITTPPVQPADAVARVSFCVQETIMGRMDNQVGLHSVRLAVGTAGGDPIVAEDFPTKKGEINRSSLPPALAVRVIKATGLGGRRGRGAMFLPWAVAEGAVDEVGNIANGEVQAWLNAMNDFKDALSEQECDLVLLHAEGATPAPPPTPVLSVGVDPIISNQVRRQVRR